ncbi:MAG: tRNA/rRNA methyltransferase [Kiritimatiellia bacterium]
MESFDRPIQQPIPGGEEQERPFKRFDRETEMKIYGVNACRAVFDARPTDIIRCYFDQGTAGRFGDIMKYCARQRLAYHLVPPMDLERIAQTGHHEGVCMLIRKRPLRSLDDFLREATGQDTTLVIALEDVRNPFNLGSVMRVSAHFGAAAILVRDAEPLHSGAAFRNAEGGAESFDIIEESDFLGAIARLRAAGFQIVSTSVHQGANLYGAVLSPRAVFLFGDEAFGLSPEATEAGDVVVQIPGTGFVESLNIAAAASTILGEQWRQVFGAQTFEPEPPPEDLGPPT